MKKRIVHWRMWGGGYAVCSPESNRYDFWFSSRHEMQEFAAEVGWILKG